MHIVFFVHPIFLAHQSMPRFAKMLIEGMKERGHNVEVLTAKNRTYKLGLGKHLKKWFGYIDQYLLFPLEVKSKLRRFPRETLFVFTDNALGPWVPLVADRFHVIHCHDFLAQLSAIGHIPENKTRRLGRMYQSYIRRGYSKGKNFISVSYKTKNHLHKLLSLADRTSNVVYNGLNNFFEPFDLLNARSLLASRTQLNLSSGYVLNVGGNQWYKNRLGVMEIYCKWRSIYKSSLPLLMIGEVPSLVLKKSWEQSLFKDDIYFLSDIEDDSLRFAYAGASLFLFPSLAEGFGWPIAEAMACGCPVITTNEEPMTEVAGNAGFLIPRRPAVQSEVEEWATKCAEVVERVITLTDEDRTTVIEKGIGNSKRFELKLAVDSIDTLYRKIIEN